MDQCKGHIALHKYVINMSTCINDEYIHKLCEQDSKLEECKGHTTLRGSLTSHKDYLKSLEATKISRAGTLSKKADKLKDLFHLLDDTLSPGISVCVCVLNLLDDTLPPGVYT